MDDIQVEKIRQAKICRESTLLHDLISNCPGKSENLRHCASSPPQIILETSCSKISQDSIGKPAVDFCFSCRAYTFVSIELCSMFSLEF